MQAKSLGGLREKLSQEGLADVSYLIVNEKAPLSRAMYWELKRQAPEGVPVYQQEILEPDVWQILDGDKDDFLIYDRCGRLAFHIPLPYSFLHFRYVESAVRVTHTKDLCGNCSLYSNSTQEVNGTAEGHKRLTQAPEQGERKGELSPEERPADHPHQPGAGGSSDPQGALPAHSHHGDPQGQQLEPSNSDPYLADPAVSATAGAERPRWRNVVLQTLCPSSWPSSSCGHHGDFSSSNEAGEGMRGT
uniref:Selenoprotein P N-terminal domain-containing protein n=1 Tax=Pelusios castaneus TaxID=367368 RepID=A0A8C8SPY2_9SAUR